MSRLYLFVIIVAIAMASDGASANSAFFHDEEPPARAHPTNRPASPLKVASAAPEFVDDDEEPPARAQPTNRPASLPNAASAEPEFFDDDDEPSLPVRSTNRPASPVRPDTTQAGPHGASFVVDTGKVTLKIEMTEKTEIQRDAGMNRPSPAAMSYYVIVASARLEGAIGTRTIDLVATCTGLRPHLGLTQPGQGSFQVPAHAAYFGPYATREQAVNRRAAVSECVPGAYIGSGSIERY